MKINQQVIAVAAAFISVSSLQSSTPVPLYNPDTARDFFSSPLSITTSITLAPLKSFFDATQEKIAVNDPHFFSQAFSAFIKKNYNQVDYAETLSRDGRQITEFLVLSNQYNFSTEQTYTGLRLFHNKLKEVSLVDDTVMEVVLKTLPVELDRHFPFNPLHSAKQKSPAKMVENIMLTEFTDHLTKPTTSTEQFFSRLIPFQRISGTAGTAHGGCLWPHLQRSLSHQKSAQGFIARPASGRKTRAYSSPAIANSQRKLSRPWNPEPPPTPRWP